MSDFKSGGVPAPDYDSDDINYIFKKTEFSEDVFVYGKLYADLGGDVQTFSTAGVERFRITKEGDVAIGTNNPNVTVDASNTSILAVGIVTAREYYGTFKGSIDPSVANDKISEGNTEAEVVDVGSDGHFKVTTEGVERFRITSDGKVGINSTIPTSALEVRGDIFARGATSNDKAKIKFGFTNGVIQSGKTEGNVGSDYLAISGNGGGRDDLIVNYSGNVGIQTNNPTSGLQVNNFFRSQLEPKTLSQPTGANWATQSAIVTRGDFAGGICLDDNGVSGYSIFTTGNGNNLHIRAGLVGQTPVEKILINSDSATDGKIKSFCQVVFYNVTQTQRDALTAQTGGVIYNTSTNKLQCWNGSSWNNLF